MRANVCGRERRVRGIVGVLLIIVAFIVGQTAGWILGIIGLYSLLSSMLSYCLFNSLLNRNSCRVYVRDPLRDHEMV